ncbi:MAG: type II toxin-antitoxin system RelE/ParE family toxin [Archangium sp.]|nr:type II toxin-antitoxin system RelE/ParE family toxin [Archangium sp.]
MHVYFTPGARADLLRMRKRWAEKARHPEVFDTDISLVLGRLATVPTTGFRARTTKRRVVFRMGTERSKLHLYYLVDTAKQLVTVLHVWSQLRAGPPKL